MPKNEFKAKSTRKPLRDVSNGIRSSKSVKKKAPDNDEQVETDALDRLLLVHSDLSSLIHQIDGIVMKALKAKVMSRKGSKEIESFTRVLSEIQSSLKPWAPRLQKPLSSHCTGSENQLAQSLVGIIPPVNEETSDVVQSPEATTLGSLVSPSPLVSWRADCTTEGGRQLFLLTPLPRPKSFSSKLQGSCKLAIQSITSYPTTGRPSLIAISRDTNDDLLEGAEEIKQSPSKVPVSLATDRESTMEPGFVSPPKFSKMGCSVFVMTPCQKMSPPKSCVLLEPISELSHKDNHGIRKSTPFPVGLVYSSGSETSESSSSEVSEDLGLKYLELFGIKQPQELGNGRKGVEASPDWLMSPPKTCILLEPPDEKSLRDSTSDYQLPRTARVKNEPTYLSLLKGNNVQRDHVSTKFCTQAIGGSSALIESTPMLKEPQSTFRNGKCAGENTLKKELWTRFEAASTHGVRLNVSVLEETAHKGFLDRLEEVCCEQTSPLPKGLI